MFMYHVGILIIVIAFIFLIYFLELCEESVTYTELKDCSSSIQKKEITRILKPKGKTLVFYCLNVLINES